MNIETISIKNREGLTIVLDICRPEGEEKGLFVLQHGWGANRQQPLMVMIRDTLIRNGYAVINLDATHSFGESDGGYELSTMGNHVCDYEDVALWTLENVPFAGKFGTTGHSLGGHACIRFAQDYPEKVDLCIPICPTVGGAFSWLNHYNGDKSEFIEWKGVGKRESYSNTAERMKYAPWSHMKERLEHDLLKKADQINMPILLCRCERDTLQPIIQHELFLECIHSQEKSLIECPGAGHTPRDPESLNYISTAITQWLTTIS